MMNSTRKKKGLHIEIEDEKCLLYFLMDQDYPIGTKYSKSNNPEIIFDNAIKNLINNPKINPEIKTMNLDDDKAMKAYYKHKDIVPLLREYYKQVIFEKIKNSQTNNIDENER